MPDIIPFPSQPAKAAPPCVEIHETQFHRNRSTGLCRALCTCGWVKFGPMEECQSAAATHDLDWVPA